MPPLTRHTTPGSTVGGRRDDGPTEQAAQPPATRVEHHILDADSDVGTHADRVAESRQSSAAPTTATAASLALEGDRDVGPRNKRVADYDDIDAFAGGEGQPAIAAVGCRKRPRSRRCLRRPCRRRRRRRRRRVSTRSSSSARQRAYWASTLSETNASSSATSLPDDC